MGWRLARWCLAGALGCGLAAPAAAQVPPKSLEARVLELRQQGRELYRKSDPQAIERLRTAWELAKDYVDLCNMGKYQLELGLEREAAATLSKCRTMIPDAEPGLGDFRKAVERMLKISRALVGAIEIESNVSGAEILIDGKAAGTFPLTDPIFVEPGWREVEVRAPGFKPDIKRVEARAGASARLKMQLSEVQPEVVPAIKEQAPPAQPAAIATKSSGPPRGAALPSKVAQGKGSPRAWPLAVGIALGLVGTSAAVGGFVAAEASHDAAEARKRELSRTGFNLWCYKEGNHSLCDELLDAADHGTPLWALGIGGLFMAGAGGVLLTYELIRASSPDAKDSARVRVTMTPGGGALWVSGSF